MRSRFFFLLLFFLSAFCTLAQSKKNKDEYRYTIDLTRVVNDRVFIELSTPPVNTPEITFYMPKIIPGTYKIADYGRFLNEFKAFDSKGKELQVEKVDVNSWKIKNAQKLAKITYWADDVIDTEKEGPEVYKMAATNIEDGKNFVINTSGFFGYLENKKSIPVYFDVIRPKDFYGSTGLIALRTDQPITILKKEIGPANADKRVDSFVTDNYDHLIDSPLMYNKADTALIRVANAEVLISCYAASGKINAKEIASTVREVLKAQGKYLGGKLPVDKYAFIFYFSDQPLYSYGALEHSYSSFYYLPEGTIEEKQQEIRGFAAHEFFHIVTPLTIHSQEIHQFDFNEPKMSKHLWLYEGVTEYFAGNVQVKYGLVTPEQYLGMMRQKMQSTDFYKDNVPFTDISKFTLDRYPEQYSNVYQKGALIGMCIDIKLRKLSQGKYGLQNLIFDLSKQYGKKKAFEDDALFSDIVKLTYPEMKEFLSRYVEGPESLPFKEIFDMVGVNYIAEEPIMVFSIGFTLNAMTHQEFEGRKRYIVTNMNNINELGRALGFQQGDVLVKINGEELPDSGKNAILGKHYQNLKEGEILNYTVLRKDQNGTYQTVELKAPIVKVEGKNRHIVSFMENATPEQLLIRKSWLSAEP